jgi:hypothetical protein
MSDKKETPEAKTNKDFKTSGLSRKHGFERPFNFYQVLSWFIFAFDILFFYFLYIPMLIVELRVHFLDFFLIKKIKISIKFSKVIVAIIFAIFGFFTIYYGYKCTICDPTDSNVYMERMSKSKGFLIEKLNFLMNN